MSGQKQLERSIVLESGEGDKLAQKHDKQTMKIIKNKKADPIIFKILIRCGLNLGQSQDTKKTTKCVINILYQHDT